MVLAAGLLLAACASEAPFEGPKDKEKGSFAKTAFSLKVQADHVIKTKAGDEVVMDDVHISFHRVNDNAMIDNYWYGYMPDIVVLEEGKYTITAVYTHDKDDVLYPANWDTPYYEGHSDEFQIRANQITSDIGTIKCVLKNVMTSIVFDSTLTDHMSDDSYVEVKIQNSSDVLNFTKSETRYGYFTIGDEHTLVATFHGKIDGAETSETKILSDISAGNHYRITFKLHDYKGENSGNLNMDVVLDASVTTTDINGEVSIEDMGMGDTNLGDAERPGEKPDEPQQPEQPVVKDAPVITALGDVKLDEPYEVTIGESVVLNIQSESGISEFVVDITSPTLTPEELEGVGLGSHLDLVEPGNLKEALNGLGLLEGDSVEGEKDVNFDITGFIPMLAALGDGTHTFTLTVTDANGTTSKELILVIKND